MHFELEHELIGGASFDAVGENVSAQVLAQAAEASAVLLGAVGGPVSQPSTTSSCSAKD